MPRSSRPRTQRRQPAVAALDRRRPSAAAARRSGPPAGGGSTRRRPASTRPACPASQPGRMRHSVPALPTSIAAGAGSLPQARRPTSTKSAAAASASPSLTRRPARRRRQVSSACRPSPGSPRSGWALGHRPDQGGPVGDRLVGGRAQLAAERPAGSTASSLDAAGVVPQLARPARRRARLRPRRPRTGRSRRSACRRPDRAPCPRC